MPGDLTGSVAAGDYIGKPTAAGNGAVETFYRVSSRAYAGGTTTITLYTKYAGTTGNTDGFNKVNPVTTGASNAVAMTLGTTDGDELSGGWNLSTETQDGETWFRPNATAGTRYCIQFAKNTTISKMNQVDGYYSTFCSTANTSLDMSYCTVLPAGAVIGIIHYSVAGQTSTVSNCTVVLYSASACLYFGERIAGSSTVSDCTFINSGTGGGVYLNGAQASGCLTFSDVNCYFGGNCVNTTSENNDVVDFSGLTLYNGVNGFVGSGNNSHYKLGTATNCTVGALVQGPCVLEGGTFTNCTTGVSATSGMRQGCVAFGMTFSGCQYGFYFNTWSGVSTISDCDFGDMTTSAIDRVGNAGTVKLFNCSIDTDSRLLDLTETSNNPTPFYVLNGCDNSSYPDGAYYLSTSVCKSSTTYRTSPYSIRIKNSSTISDNYNNYIPIVSVYTTSGVGKVIRFYVKADVGWTGTIEPVFRLNDIIVDRKTTITSITNDWVEYEYTLAAEDVTTDGIVDLAFRCNMDTTPFFIDKSMEIEDVI